MVSTRGVRYKFSEGERVLCYEPDPTKAKVLYDSKVLEVIESKDKRGRRTVEYLIHFQGWNSSWDRCVSEDFVLKDTEENRQLQRDLAEKSQLQLGAYLYRRERKKGSSSSGTGCGPAKRPRLGFSDDGSSSSTTQPDEPGEMGASESSSDEESGSQTRSPPPTPGRGSIPLPPPLRDRLTFDYHLVVKRGKLVRLPASPCAAKILETYLKWYAKAGAWHPHKGRNNEPPQRPDLMDVSCRLNVIREIVDGLRVYFDFVLRGHLLYKQEVPQYLEARGKYAENQGGFEASTSAEPTDVFEFDAEIDGKMPESVLSPTFPEYSHLPPFTRVPKSEKDKLAAQNDLLFNSLLDPPPEGGAGAPGASGASGSGVKTERPASPEPSTSHAQPKHREFKPAPRTSNLARRLRSHRSAMSQSETDEPVPSTSTTEPRTFETLSSSMGSSGSSMSEFWTRPPPSAAAPRPTKTPLSVLLDKVSNWEIIPEDKTEFVPCRVYGAVHLARLLVKLPDFLNATGMPDYKLKLILKHIDMFVRYLDEHHEWFGETYYLPECLTRSH